MLCMQETSTPACICLIAGINTLILILDVHQYHYLNFTSNNYNQLD